MEYNVENILNHLEYVTKSYYSNKLDSTSAVNSSRAIDAIEDGLYESETQSKDATDTRYTTNTAIGIGVSTGVVGAVGAAVSGIAGKSWAAMFGKTALEAGTKAAVQFGAGFTTLFGTGIGAGVGVYVGNQLVNGSIARYTNDDGTFNNGKANWVKFLSGLTGALVGWSLSNAIQSGGVSLWGLIPAGIFGLITGLVHHFG